MDDVSRIVTGAGVWPAITAVLKTRKRKLVAVAFLGSDAPDLLATLGREDLLVCDASRRALKSGATSPDALQVFLDRGVRVRSHPRLHAKIYISGDSPSSARPTRPHRRCARLRPASSLPKLSTFRTFGHSSAV